MDAAGYKEDPVAEGWPWGATEALDLGGGRAGVHCTRVTRVLAWCCVACADSLHQEHTTAARRGEATIVVDLEDDASGNLQRVCDDLRG